MLWWGTIANQIPGVVGIVGGSRRNRFNGHMHTLDVAGIMGIKVGDWIVCHWLSSVNTGYSWQLPVGWVIIGKL